MSKNKQKDLIPAEGISDLVRFEDETLENKTRETLYYEQKYARFKDQDIFVSWNWGAFFFGLAWLWYRKMYAYFFALMILQFFIQLLIQYRFASGYSEFNPDVSWALAQFFIENILLCGLFGNAIYFRFLRTKYMNHVRYLGTNHWLVTFIVVLALGFSFTSMLDALVKIFTS
jgi:hypothetical protein